MKSDISDTVQPEITMTDVNNELSSETDCKQSFNFLKRVNSANNLAIPGK